MNNMYIAAKRVSGQILQPGEVYSYMSALGPITVANGFENASVLIGANILMVLAAALSAQHNFIPGCGDSRPDYY